MRIIKQSARKQPRLSLILLDWGVRESLHLLHYLKDQTVSHDAFEVILIEFYSGISKAVEEFASELDTWILLEMPEACYYHKHLMYNVGAVFAKGDIVMIADSDAMVRPTFVETVLRAFERDPLMVYHMDEFRNVRRNLYPFNYPSFEEVLGEGSINNVHGKTKGILDVMDPMHTRNYGACMCARREDIIAIGGADEDMTYLGHVCGPYDMTFRLMNFERRLCWETGEYLYHTWHPGSDGIDNYLGPHDGRNMSTTAFQALCAGRIPPLVENEVIRALRTGSDCDLSGAKLCDLLINPQYVEAFDRTKLRAEAILTGTPVDQSQPLYASYRGYDIYPAQELFCAVPTSAGQVDLSGEGWRQDTRLVEGRSFQELRDLIDSFETRYLETVGPCNVYRVGERFAAIPNVLGQLNLLFRPHREHPAIVWTETEAEARRAAIEMTPPPYNGGLVHQTEAVQASEPVRASEPVQASEAAQPASQAPIAAGADGELVPLRAAIEELQAWMARAKADRDAVDYAQVSDIEILRGRIDSVESVLAAVQQQRTADIESSKSAFEELQEWMARTEGDCAGMDCTQMNEIENLRRRIDSVESILAALRQQRASDTELAQEQLGNLQRQLSAIDSGLTAIYRSRIWRALTGIGRVLPGAGAPGRERKN